MSAIKFGIKQLKQPTPANWSNGINIFTIVASTILVWIGTPNFIPLGLSSVIQSILGLLIGISNALKPFIGVRITQKEIPIESVKVVEVPKDISDKNIIT